MGAFGRGVLLGAVGLALLGGPDVEAGAPTDAVRDVFTKANRLLVPRPVEGDMAERIVALRKLLNTAFDVRDAARHSLGSEWQARTRREQDEFTDLFGDLLQRSYVHWMASLADIDESAGLRVRYISESAGRDTAIVNAVIVGKDRDGLRLDHEMVRRGDRWLIREVRLGDVRLVTNYRAQFRRVLRDVSYAGLVARMKARVTETD